MLIASLTVADDYGRSAGRLNRINVKPSGEARTVSWAFITVALPCSRATPFAGDAAGDGVVPAEPEVVEPHAVASATIPMAVTTLERRGRSRRTFISSTSIVSNGWT